MQMDVLCLFVMLAVDPGQAGAFAEAVVLDVGQTKSFHAVDDDGVVRLRNIKRNFGSRHIRLHIACGYHIGCRIGDTHVTGWYEN